METGKRIGMTRYDETKVTHSERMKLVSAQVKHDFLEQHEL